MPSFTYTARAINGDLRTATLEAPNRDEVLAQLKRQRLVVIKVDEAEKKAKPAGKVKMRDIVIFTRQFSTMINAGLPLVQALDIRETTTAPDTILKVYRDAVAKKMFNPAAELAATKKVFQGTATRALLSLQAPDDGATAKLTTALSAKVSAAAGKATGVFMNRRDSRAMVAFSSWRCTT